MTTGQVLKSVGASISSLPTIALAQTNVNASANANASGLNVTKVSAELPASLSTVQISSQALALYNESLAAPAAPTYTVAKALSLGASASAGSLAISDSAANISKNFDKLVAIAAKISAIKQTDAKALGVTEAQFSAGLSPSPQDGLLSKVNSGQYNVIISGVHTANLSGIASYGSKVTAITIGDSSANIATKLSDIAALGAKVASITQTSKTPLALSYANTLQYANVLGKIDKGNYTLNLTDTASTIKTNMAAITKLGGKVAAISQTDASQAIPLTLASMNANSATLKKINGGVYKVSLEDSAAVVNKSWTALTAIKKNITAIRFTDPIPALSLTAAQAADGADLINKVSNGALDLTVTDNANNLSNNLSGLLALNSKISKVKQTAVGHISVPQGLLADNTFTSFLSKINPSSYSLAVTGVDKANLASVVSNTHVQSIALNVTDGSLSSNDSNTTAALASKKISSINVSNAVVAALGALTADKRVTSIGLRDSAAHLSNASNLAAIDALMKKNKRIISAIDLNVDTHDLVTVGQSDYLKYAATVYSAPKNYALEVDLGTPTANIALNQSQNRSALKTTANSNGSFTVQVWDFAKGAYNKPVTLNAGVDFVKLGSTSTFLDSGDAKLNAILNVGSYKWQQNPDQATVLSSDYALKPGVFSLGSTSANPTITYKFLNSSSDASLSANDKVGFAAMNADQRSAVTSALNYISSLVNIHFELVDGSATSDLNFGTNDQGTTSGGYATGANSALGAVNLLLNNKTSVNTQPLPGDYGWETILHEIGHTLGLKHPGAYNAGGGAAPGPYLPAADDHRRNTIMSYNNPADAKTHWVSTEGGYSNQGVNPTTFMPLDILALQFLYGKNQSGTSLSDNTKSLADFQTTQFSSNWIGMQTLSSTSAGLSVDLSGVSASNIVDLRAGAFSSINIKDTSYNAGIGGTKAQTFYNLNNVGLAYDASISSLIGGSSSDVVYVSTNDVAIDGNAGTDTVYLYGKASDWTQSQGQNETLYTNGSVTARLKNVESIAYYALANSPTTHSRIDLMV